MERKPEIDPAVFAACLLTTTRLAREEYIEGTHEWAVEDAMYWKFDEEFAAAIPTTWLGVIKKLEYAQEWVDAPGKEHIKGVLTYIEHLREREKVQTPPPANDNI